MKSPPSRTISSSFLTTTTLGWSEVQGDDITVVEVPGNHLNLLVAPNVMEVAGYLRVSTDECPSR